MVISIWSGSSSDHKWWWWCSCWMVSHGTAQEDSVEGGQWWALVSSSAASRVTSVNTLGSNFSPRWVLCSEGSWEKHWSRPGTWLSEAPERPAAGPQGESTSPAPASPHHTPLIYKTKLSSYSTIETCQTLPTVRHSQVQQVNLKQSLPDNPQD